MNTPEGHSGQSYDCPSIAARPGGRRIRPRRRLRAVLRLPLHCGAVFGEQFSENAEAPGSLTTAPPLRLFGGGEGLDGSGVSGQSYDCPSIAAPLRRRPRPRSAPPGSLTTAPPLRRWTPARRVKGRTTPGSLTTAPPLRRGTVRDTEPDGSSPGSLTTAPPLRQDHQLGPVPRNTAPGSLTTAPPLRPVLGPAAVAPVAAPGSLTTAPPLRLVTPLASRAGQDAPGSLTTAPPLRQWDHHEYHERDHPLRAVLRLPLHCGCRLVIQSHFGVGSSGQSYDCPSIAAAIGWSGGRWR